jgi:CDP-glycerol glycerophosphotransferase
MDALFVRGARGSPVKIDKRKPSHWVQLLLFAAQVAIAIALRPFRRRGTSKHVVLYGHKLTGNLWAIYQHLVARCGRDIMVTFLTMDKPYHRQLMAQGIASVSATSFACQRLLRRTDVIISDHGLHVLSALLGRPGIRFVDVWHGFGFKGHHYDDFRVLRRYDEVWVDSPLQRSFYVEHFGFAPERVIATGYARIDALVNPTADRVALRRRFGLPETGKVVLFAPTWQHAGLGSGLFPFSVSPELFYATMSAFAARTDCVFVTRAHLNAPIHEMNSEPRLRFLPFSEYPDTEALLLACDVLLADWSSIVFDWLLLDRPAVFLDVPPPFPVGSTLQPGHRYGHLAGSMAEMVQALERYVARPDDYTERFGAQAALVRREVFGDCADGYATQRCVKRLEALIAGLPKPLRQ